MSNKYYTFVGVIADKIYHRYVEDGIRKSEVVENFKFELFVKAHHGTHTSLFGDKLARMEFNSITEMKEFHRSHSRMGEVFGNTSPVHQFIAKTYPGELVAEGKDYVVLNYDIETAYDDATGFSSPTDASNQVMSINMKVFGNPKSYTMGLKAYEPEDENDIYFHCYSEKDLLLKFINKWEELNPDYVTGWNCVPLTNTLWYENKIQPIKKVKYMDKLHDSYVEHVFPISQKNKCEIVLDNNQKLFASKEHILPVKYVKRGGFINPLDISRMISRDLTVGEISTYNAEHDIYVELPIHSNVNKNLTWGDYIFNNIESLTDIGLDFVIKDTIMVKKMSAALGYGCHDNKKYSFWNYQNIKEKLGVAEIKAFFERNRIVKVINNNLTQGGSDIHLDDNIPNDMLWLLGMWYTDGTSSYKTDVTICNSNINIIEKCKTVMNKYFRTRPIKELNRAKDGCFYLDCSLSASWFIKPFIYTDIPSKSQKRLNVELLSQLSKEQFMSFFAGCIDGDGSINARISLCNYNDDIGNFVELLNWNGVFSSITSDENILFTSFINDENFKNELSHSEKIKNYNTICKETRLLDTKCRQKTLRWIYTDNTVLVKVKDVIFTDDIVDMIDISTDTSYFVSNGIKVHNCKLYDNVYIINRIKKILGTKAANRLSPFHAYSNYVIKDKKTKDAYGNETPEYEIFGVTTLDYIELYKKYAPAKLESYRLEFVSHVENGTGKVPYDEYGSIQNMFDGNYKIQKDVDKETLPEKDRWCRNRTIVEAEMERRQKLKEVAND